MQPFYTIARHIVEQERHFPQATGEFTNLLWDLTIAFKIISNEVNRAGLVDILGMAGGQNVHGEDVRKLDLFAHDVIVRAMEHGGHLCLMASEESPHVIDIPDQFKKGKYVLLFDPLDGSSNIDVGVNVGTIFSILRKESPGEKGVLADCLQPGSKQVAAGYTVYGSSTMLVYSTGRGANGFTLDPGIGEFLLSHPRLTIPEAGSIYSVNEGNLQYFDRGTRDFLGLLRSGKGPSQSPYSLRYVGSLVADIHRTLLKGGVFLYPATFKEPEGPKAKLRLLYEANPIALLLEQAGGLATNGNARIMDLMPRNLHHTTPLVAGSRREVELYQSILAAGPV
jgi:fructose-1,6-bisphosphatase I